MSNKLLKQQLKNILNSLNKNDLEKVFQTFENISKKSLEKITRTVSYKWFINKN